MVLLSKTTKPSNPASSESFATYAKRVPATFSIFLFLPIFSGAIPRR
jgi:hypothetical protein